MAELKPCPFCGSKDVGVYEITYSYWETRKYVLCRTCEARTKGALNENEIVDAWNRRAKRDENA